MALVKKTIQELGNTPYLGVYHRDFEEFWLGSLRADTLVEARLELEEIFDTLDYFDGAHFASWLGKETSSLISMGLKDMVCPPPTIYSLYKALEGKKELLVYPEYGHEVPDEYVDWQLEFLAKELELEG